MVNRWILNIWIRMVSFNYWLVLRKEVALSNYQECSSLVFTDRDQLQGTFNSPMFPYAYPAGIECLLYSFIGDKTNIVEITFLEFDLQLPFAANRCIDYLRIYLDLESPHVSDSLDSWNHELCGNISTIPKQHYSSSNFLAFKFFTNRRQSNHTGFRGIYKFLDKAQFAFEGGILRPSTVCTYDFYSNRKGSKTGQFFSPRYPQHYPANTSCQYIFHCLPGERVKIVFNNVQLESVTKSCLVNPDRIVVREGFQSPNSFIIAQFCDTLNSESVCSTISGSKLFVELISNDVIQRQGFAATYSFIADQLLKMSTESDICPKRKPPDGGTANFLNPGDSPIEYISGIDIHTTTREYLKKPASDCERKFTSTEKLSGLFMSPFYPDPHPVDLICRYIFQGQAHERVQVIFTDLDLGFSQGSGMIGNTSPRDPHNCDDVDSVIVSVVINSNLRHIAVFCGNKRPPMLMSADNRLEIAFVTKTNQARGFKANFSFVTDCGFVFRSDRASNGTITSPNFPGLYPRNTECHYLFYGEDNERIHITFPYFDIEGVPPSCSEETQSDYVEFSNFNVRLVDRKMTRFCGTKEEIKSMRSINSDSSFFRVSFYSNEIYDGTGFEAFYQFRKIEGLPEKWVNRPPASSFASSGIKHCVVLSTLTSLLSILFLPRYNCCQRKSDGPDRGR